MALADHVPALLERLIAGGRVFDVTVSLSQAVPLWPTYPVTELKGARRITRGDSSNVSRAVLASHAGAHVDAPWHFVADGKTLLEIPLSRWLGPSVVRIADAVRLIEPGHLETVMIPPGSERLLPRIANSAAWVMWNRRDPLLFREDDVGFSPEAARWAVERGIELIGIDYLSIGVFRAANRETHLTLLRNDVLIVETLDFSGVDPGPYGLVCLPCKLWGGDGAPARVLPVDRQ